MAKFYSKASLALSVIIGLGTNSHLYADDGVTWADIENEMYKKDEHGQMLRSVDKAHEAKIQKMMLDYGGTAPRNRVYG